MKVGFLLGSISRKAGGLFEICRRLAQTSCQEHEISVLGIADEYTDADMKEWAPLRPAIFRALGPGNFDYAPGYAKYLAATSPDIVHVHGLWIYPSLAAHLWHRRTKRPFIYTAHGMLDPWALRNSAWKKRVVRVLWEDAAHRSAACFHVNSLAEYLTVRRYGLGNPICVIPNGVDLPDLSETPKPQFQAFSEGRNVLLYLGRLHPKKNLVNLIRAWKQTLDSHRGDWVLAIAGWDQGGYEAQLRQLTTDLGLLTSVIFVGPQFGAEKSDCYRACDAFILPSLSEGLPMAVLEAWAHAKPVLMTPECNLPEGFEANAALRIGKDPEEIATSLRQLIQMSDNDRAAMGIHGRTLVAKSFSWPRIGQQMSALYEWVLGAEMPNTVRL